MSRIAVVVMVKNEARGIARTIRSCNDPRISGIIVYDTGSEDDTLEIIKRESTLPVDILEGVFEDFETSRNVCLDFANSIGDYDYFLFMDADDELIFDETFDPSSLDDSSADAWFVNCRWLLNSDRDPTTYYSIRMIRSRLSDIRWKGVVHEYLNVEKHETGQVKGLMLYQDRIQSDDGKSRARWSRDRVLLEKEFEKNPENLRTIFYLAQTYQCLNEHEMAYKFYELRSRQQGFQEEQFWAMERCGDTAKLLNINDWAIAVYWYSKAFCTCERVEPLINIAKIYSSLKQFKLAYIHARLACDLEYPKDAILFVDTEYYNYERWHQLGIVSWYAALNENDSEKRKAILEDGYRGCAEAIRARDREIDRKNLVFYEQSRTTSNEQLI